MPEERVIEISREDEEDRFSNNRDMRAEERWHASLELLAKRYRHEAVTMSELYDRAGYSARMKHLIFGMPPPVIALSITLVSTLWIDPNNVYLIAPLGAVAGISSAVHSFLDLGGKAQSYWSYAASYGKVVKQIDTTLARDIDFRTPPDAFFAEMTTEMTNLNGNAPQLPGKGCCGCTKYQGKPSLPEPELDADYHYRYARPPTTTSERKYRI